MISGCIAGESLEVGDRIGFGPTGHMIRVSPDHHPAWINCHRVAAEAEVVEAYAAQTCPGIGIGSSVKLPAAPQEANS